MKKSLLLIVPFVLLFLNACATDADEGFDASSVCPAEGTNAYGMPNRGTFVDERDGQVYKYTTIGDQVWMAQNLNYDVEYSMCYDNNSENCEIFGKLYSLRLNGDQNDSLDIGILPIICPKGWRMPNEDDFDKLLNNMSSDKKIAATQLKFAGLWNEEEGVGSNDCGFAALPSGFCLNATNCDRLYIGTLFSSITMENSVLMRSLDIERSAEVGSTTFWQSIRCIKD